MNKLAALGVNIYLLRWLWDYLSNHPQYVVVNGSASNLVHVASGVPQGSVLGPLLFLIFIDDIADVTLTSGSLFLYADDMLLYRSIHSQHDFNLLQQDIDTLQAWCSQNVMKFNVSKCKFMIISRKPSPLQPLSVLKIDDTLLAQVPTFKYLGVWLSVRLDWSIHVQAITKSAARTVGMLYRRFYKHASSRIVSRARCSGGTSARFSWQMECKQTTRHA